MSLWKAPTHLPGTAPLPESPLERLCICQFIVDEEVFFASCKCCQKLLWSRWALLICTVLYLFNLLARTILNICAFLFLYKLTSTCRQSWSWKSSQEALEHPWVDLQCHFRWVNEGSVVWFKCLVSANSSEFSPLISVKVKKSSPKSLSADRWYTVGQLSADSIPTVNQKLPNSMIRINSIALNEISICDV